MTTSNWQITTVQMEQFLATNDFFEIMFDK